MKKAIALAVAALALAAPTTATAADAGKGKSGNLQRQIDELRSRVSGLERRIAWEGDWSNCAHAVQQDQLNIIFEFVAEIAGAPMDFPPYDDQGSCARLGIERVPYAAASVTRLATVAQAGRQLALLQAEH